MSSYYQRLSWGAVALHLMQAIATCALTIWLDSHNTTSDLKKGVFPLYKSVHVWKKTVNTSVSNSPIASHVWVETVVDRAGTLDVRWVIVSFFAMSASFPAAVLWLGLSPSFRFVEYSISASTMIMAIAVEAGVDQIYTLQSMFVLTFATMMLGLLAEFTPPPLSWIAHAIGWVTFLSAYSPILDSFLQSNARSEASAPGFVQVIVCLQFVLFASFGLVQVYSLFFAKEPHSQAEHQELLDYASKLEESEQETVDDTLSINLAYVFLSFISKTLLAWLILSPVLF